ncbi:hypothetical protein FKG94_12430 [Exilibacterium tricleocarpae]|uniref:Uncharacterized protein n=1 Tax=Exilibacterium tricleocarpae TaxID=2591008 RepID=A0A545TNM8_9GAMM|nr:glycoside hydrolase family 88 protein [Exilibacterium tricleocarpae]TQV78822.1 hypothetical protein FKG94_12430 [Exilibacterium tricleocarpae]
MIEAPMIEAPMIKSIVLRWIAPGSMGCLLVLLSVLIGVKAAAAKAPVPDAQAVAIDLQRVADWQIAHFRDTYGGRDEPHHIRDWTNSALYVGMLKFTYGLAWGVNNGLLKKKKYLPAIHRAWAALTSHVTAEGMLGYVQPIGAEPGQAWPDKSEVYGSGAFLAAGSEVYRLIRGPLPVPIPRSAQLDAAIEAAERALDKERSNSCIRPKSLVCAFCTGAKRRFCLGKRPLETFVSWSDLSIDADKLQFTLHYEREVAGDITGEAQWHSYLNRFADDSGY